MHLGGGVVKGEFALSTSELHHQGRGCTTRGVVVPPGVW